jgi:hypothetical protein
LGDVIIWGNSKLGVAMESGIWKEMISVIRTEEQRRALLLRDEDPEAAYDQWLFKDEPFVNELCILLLVGLRHQVERELVGLGALAANEGQEIEGSQYSENVAQLRKGRSWDWKEIGTRLKLTSSEEYRFMEALRLLVNSYKHDHSAGPAEDLKQLLDLPKVNYAALPESSLLRERLAVFIGLGENVTYCDVAERFVDIAVSFLRKVKGQATLSRIKPQIIMLKPEDFLH